ncbi:channel protein TolC [Methylobacterium radiotolerans]|uniref:Type I secretion outer membrane protein, TolC family n=4 Tax=Alphaproteobacteria TaxID=28211 RepID=B1LZC7_METRJ|nr:type I secretion outer membrane protein, TolC family [Methylobacterium radiotolerans JCM 2831]KIU27716.1 channel protein TolC [Methylobacterium radiotolerans]
MTRRPPASCPTFRLAGMVSGLAMLAAMPASAETLESALAKAYQGNPSLNASRAGVRAIDENVAIAQSGYRPTVNVNAAIGVQYLQTRSSSSVASAGTAGTTATTAGAGLGTTGGGLGGTAGAGTTGTGTTTGIGTTGIGTAGGTTGIGTSGAGAAGSATGGEGLAGGATSDIASQVITSRRTTRTTYLPSSASLNVTQTLFNGFQTDNTVRRAESQVYSQRESLRFTELTVLYNAVQAYMNVLSNTATLELNRNNVEVLEEQLRQTRDRFNVGEVTRTDVAQAEARLAGARSQVAQAESTLRTSIGVYRQNIGVEPRQLAPGRPLDRFVPRSLDQAIAVGLREHPQVVSAIHNVDASEAQVKVLEGQLAPQLSLQGSLSQLYDQNGPNQSFFVGFVGGRLSIPIYEGGQTYAQIRQAKESVGQARIQVDQIRDQVRAQIVDFWGRLEAAKAQVIAAQAQVQANEVALNGVREEARVGQRTTLDVLNAQQELLNSRVNLIVAQRDRVIFSYGVVQAIGQLTARFTALPVEYYSAKVHYDQVKDLWFGLRTPDGR